MGFLSWIKNRGAGNAAPAAPEKPRPEYAREMYAREAAAERAGMTPLDRMPADQRAQVDAIKAKLENATRHIAPEGQAASSVTDGNEGRQGGRQNMAAQDKAAPALSPTSAQAGKPKRESARPAREKPSRPQSLPRPKPSWER